MSASGSPNEGSLVQPLQNSPVSADEFKRGMRQLAASVSIISADCAGHRAGFTATAVTSVCADPPTLLVCVNRSSQTFPLMREAGRAPLLHFDAALTTLATS
jgi:3-hydroxy-9,10-secoandrosta-1,3,5(10)-triene-9,17-dione monooxygenase reductase component